LEPAPAYPVSAAHDEIAEGTRRVKDTLTLGAAPHPPRSLALAANFRSPFSPKQAEATSHSQIPHARQSSLKQWQNSASHAKIFRLSSRFNPVHFRHAQRQGCADDQHCMTFERRWCKSEST
jgi:hypothetical protein